MEITLKDLKELLSEKEKNNALDGCFNGKYCLIRAYSSGVHCGYVKEEYGQDIILTDSRRIWSWSGAFTLSKVAADGFQEAKMSVPIKEIKIKQVIEIIPLSDIIKEKFKNWKVHNE